MTLALDLLGIAGNFWEGLSQAVSSPRGRQSERVPGGVIQRSSFSLPFLVIFINGLAKATESMWIRFGEDRKLGGMANVWDEEVGMTQTSAGWALGPVLT